MGTKSRETLYGGAIRASAEKAKVARRDADVLACKAWNDRMLGYKGPAQPSPTLGDALNAGFGYLEVRCIGCDTHQTVALDIIRRPKASPAGPFAFLPVGSEDCGKDPLISRRLCPGKCDTIHDPRGM